MNHTSDISEASKVDVSSSPGIGRSIVALAFPAILSNITVPLLGLSDTFISGHLGSEIYIAAIAVGTMMVNTLYWLFGFLRMGTTGMVAEAVGLGDKHRRRQVLTASLLLGFLAGMVLICLSPWLGRLMGWIMDVSPDSTVLGQEYFRISVLSAPAMLATMALTGWMIGSQNTVGPMIVAISVNVINILLSFTLVFYFGLGFLGVAAGTATANWCGLFLAFFIARRIARHERLTVPLHGLWSGLDIKRFFKVNSDLMIRSACIMSVIFAMTSFGGRMGDLTLAVNAIVMQFFMFFSYFMDGFAYSGEALCGKFAGASDRRGIIVTVRILMLWALVMTVAFTLLYGFAATPIAGVLTDELPVVAGVGKLHPIVMVIPLISAAAFVFDGVYIGMTATRTLLWVTMIAMGVYFFVYLTPWPGVSSPDNLLLWISFLLFLLLRGALLGLRLPSHLPPRKISSSIPDDSGSSDLS